MICHPSEAVALAKASGGNTVLRNGKGKVTGKSLKTEVRSPKFLNKDTRPQDCTTKRVSVRALPG
jgi:hypothetical protein